MFYWLKDQSIFLYIKIINSFVLLFKYKRLMKTSFDIKEPGLNVLPPGVERHVVNGGGLTGLQIFPDDEIEIINDEGNQVCEIVVFDKNGKSDLGILNLKENSKNSEIKKS